MDRRDLLLGLTGRLLAAPGSHQGWQVFLLDLCDVLHGSNASLISHDLATKAGSVGVTARLDREAVALYEQHWHQYDPWVRGPKIRRFFGKVFLSDELVRHDAVRRTAFYNEFGRRYDIAHCIAGVGIELNGERLGLTIDGSEKRDSFDERDRELLAALMPRVKTALVLQQRLAGAELLATGLASVLERLPHSIFLLSRNGHVRLMNRMAEELLATGELSLERGELRASTATGTSRLRASLRHAGMISNGRLIHAETTFSLERLSSKRPLSILAAPLPPNQIFLGREAVAIALFVTDPEHQPRGESSILREMFGLTRAEAELVTALLEGLSVKEAAERFELATDTVRKRLKVIFQKTDTHRQSELIRHVFLSTLLHAPGNGHR